ncbi:MAG: hypothetical protein ABJF10_24505 [Chthoniobacter sp.]|uniref:hypothetical protein n=1 Tax=Chthoniobacter sp. TaxID=2510640 RepID=UPI0032A316CE
MREAGKELSADQRDILESVRKGADKQQIADQHGITVAEVDKKLADATAALDKAKSAAVAELTEHIKQVEPAPLYALQDRVNAVAGDFAKKMTAAKAMVTGLKEGFEFGKEQHAFIERQKGEMAGALRRLIIEALPSRARAALADAVTRLVAEPVTLRADGKNEQRLQTLFKKAIGIAGKTLDKAEDLRKAAIVEGIKKVADRVSGSPGVDVEYQRRIQGLINNLDFSKPRADTVAALQGTKDYIAAKDASLSGHAVPAEVIKNLERLNKLPVRDLPTHVLESILGDMALLEKLGRLKLKTREAVAEARQEVAKSDIAVAKTTPINQGPIMRAQPGEELPWVQKLRNKITTAQNYAKVFGRALLPISAVTDALGEGKARYNGPLERHFIGRADTAYNDYLVSKNELQKPFDDLLKKHNLSQSDSERFAVHAIIQQEGGEERLKAMGVESRIIEQNRVVSPALAEVYGEWKKIEARVFPEVSRVAREAFNQHVQKVDSYFPLMRDHDSFLPDQAPTQVEGGRVIPIDEAAAWRGLADDFAPMPKKTTARGMTFDRVKNATSPIRLDGFAIVRQHVADAMYFAKMTHALNDMAAVVNDPIFPAKYGDIGQRIMRDWIDTIARRGGVDISRREPWLDTLRQHLSLGSIGFRLASNIKHASNMAFSMYHAGGPGWYSKGLRESLSDRPNDWISKNAAEVLDRHGAEPAQEELERGSPGTKWLGKVSVAAQKYAFLIARNIDQINARATFIGAYQHELAKAGKDPSNYLNEPVDRNRVNLALSLMRRAVASANPKDQPQALSRGSGIGGNVSIAKSVFAFQNVFLDMYSNLRHDFIRAGITEKDPGKALAMGAVLLASTLMETGIEHAVRGAEASITGHKKDDKHEDSFMKSVGVNVLRRIPFMSQALGVIRYGGSGVPVLDVLPTALKNAYKVGAASSPQARNKAAVSVVQQVAEMSGVPGSGYAGDLIKKALPDAPKGRHN